VDGLVLQLLACGREGRLGAVQGLLGLIRLGSDLALAGFEDSDVGGDVAGLRVELLTPKAVGLGAVLLISDESALD